MTAIATPPDHRVQAAVGRAREALSSVAGERPWSLTATQTTAALAELQALKAQTAELEARLLTHAGQIDLPGQTGATSTASWLAHTHKLTRPAAHRQTRLAAGLEDHDQTREALATGRVNPEQAEAILRGLATLPDDLRAELVAKAETHLLDLARDFDAKALTHLSRRLLEVIAPEVADAHEAALLDKQERDAEDANRLRVWDTPDGRVRGEFDLDGFSGSCLKKALFAHAAPKHRAASGPLEERKPTAERLGQAFAEYVRRYPQGKLPSAGGLNATVVVLMSYETLMGDLKAARLDTGEHLSPGLARRIACEAGLVPAVLGGTSQVLDLGRTRRFHSTAQRLKATIEQGGCLAEGHDCPPAFTQMHHPVPWSHGGHTDAHGWMLCPAAHRRVHDPRYTHEQLPNGKIRFHRRT